MSFGGIHVAVSLPHYKLHTYSTLVLMLPLFFCELHHTFLLLSHTLYDILRQVPSFLFSLSPPLACLVLFASWFHHSPLSVDPGHFFLRIFLPAGFLLLSVLKLLTRQTQHLNIRYQLFGFQSATGREQTVPISFCKYRFMCWC